MKYLVPAMVVAVLLVAGGALAQVTPKERAACKGDWKPYCRNTQAGTEVVSCLVAYRSRLRVSCRKVLAAHGILLPAYLHSQMSE